MRQAGSSAACAMAPRRAVRGRPVPRQGRMHPGSPPSTCRRSAAVPRCGRDAACSPPAGMPGRPAAARPAAGGLAGGGGEGGGRRGRIGQGPAAGGLWNDAPCAVACPGRPPWPGESRLSGRPPRSDGTARTARSECARCEAAMPKSSRAQAAERTARSECARCEALGPGGCEAGCAPAPRARIPTRPERPPRPTAPPCQGL